MRTEIQTVQSSHARHVAPAADALSKLFVQRLFATAPETRALLTGDLERRRRELVRGLARAVAGLDDMETLTSELSAQLSGKAGRRSGLAAAPHDKVGAALLWTLQNGLGPAKFTPEVKAAWATVCVALTDAMRGDLRAAA